MARKSSNLATCYIVLQHKLVRLHHLYFQIYVQTNTTHTPFCLNICTTNLPTHTQLLLHNIFNTEPYFPSLCRPVQCHIIILCNIKTTCTNQQLLYFSSYPHIIHQRITIFTYKRTRNSITSPYLFATFSSVESMLSRICTSFNLRCMQTRKKCLSLITGKNTYHRKAYKHNVTYFNNSHIHLYQLCIKSHNRFFSSRILPNPRSTMSDTLSFA